MNEDVFHVASRGDVRQLRLLIRKGRIEDTDEDGNTPLILAAKHNRLPAVNLLLGRKANVNHANVDGDTAMHVAAERGIMHVSIVRRLFEAGANIFAMNSLRETPISLITKNIKLARHPKMAVILEKRDSVRYRKKKQVKSDPKNSKLTVRKQSIYQAGGAGRSTQLNAYDANSEDVASFRQIWDVLIANGNSLDSMKLAPVFQLLNIHMTTVDYTVFMDLLDSDQDGLVNFDDFYVSMMWRKHNDNQDMYAIDIPFDALDTCLGSEPPTGMISRSSYKAAEKVLGPIFFADNDRDVNRIFATLIPNFPTLIKMDANAGLDRKLFAKVVSGRHEFQQANTMNQK